VFGDVSGTAFLDVDVANDRQYVYVVQAVGTSGACAGPGSPCIAATPRPCAGPGCVPPGEVQVLRWDDRTSPSWSEVADVAGYVLYRGAGSDVAKLATSESDSCARLATPLAGASGVSETPPPGAWTWWLVRAESSTGLGPPGSASAGPRQHDPAGACP
jgi:hypothetical protein